MSLADLVASLAPRLVPSQYRELIALGLAHRAEIAEALATATRSNVVEGQFRVVDPVPRPTSEGDAAAFVRCLDDADDFLGLVLGRPGSGKTAFCCRVLERRHKRRPRAYIVGVPQRALDAAGVGDWLVEIDADALGDARDADLLIDDAARFLSSREYASPAAKEFRRLVDERRHRGVGILVNAQEGRALNADAMSAEFLALKPSASFFPAADRDYLRPFLAEAEEVFGAAGQDAVLHHAMIYSRFVGGYFRGLLSYDWPMWYSEAISKSKAGL